MREDAGEYAKRLVRELHITPEIAADIAQDAERAALESDHTPEAFSPQPQLKQAEGTPAKGEELHISTERGQISPEITHKPEKPDQLGIMLANLYLAGKWQNNEDHGFNKEALKEARQTINALLATEYDRGQADKALEQAQKREKHMATAYDRGKVEVLEDLLGMKIYTPDGVAYIEALLAKLKA